MKKIIRRFTILIIILAIVDFLSGFILDKTMNLLPETTSQTAHTNTFIKHVDSDVIILGSSRATHHYIPSIISDSLGLSVYNCGQEGMDVTYNFCCLERIISRKTPKIVLLDMDESYYLGGSTQRITCLNPYYKDSRSIKDAIDLTGDAYVSFKMFFNLYRYNGKLFNIVSAVVSPVDTLNGYLPLYGSISGKPVEHDINYAEKIDSIVFDGFQNIVNICKYKGIKLIVINSPIFVKNKFNFQFTQQYCAENDITYLNFGNDIFYLNRPDLFWDATHLNNEGATIFSSNIAHFLKKEKNINSGIK